MIKLITGPMMAGKTTELLRLLIRAKIAGKKTILIRPEIDTRGFLTHDKKEAEETLIEEKFLREIKAEELTEYDVIGIDEGQFFGQNLAEEANKLADQGKTIIISALNATSERTAFDNIQALIPHAEEIIKLNAICIDCGSEYATYSYYTAGRKKDKIKVGGSSDYIALCRHCYKRRVEQS